MLKKGEILAKRYQIISLLGEGGMSKVYKVKDLRLENFWALKEFVYPLKGDEEARQLKRNFIREAKICARLTHPGIAGVVDFFSIGNRHYLVEEFVRGKTLLQILESNPKKLPDVVSISLKICDVLEYVHSQKIVYRDLKPDNIMVQSNGSIKLLDFGIARSFKKEKKKDTLIMGTPGYASPEQYGSSQTDNRSDVYSLGALMHHVLTGKDPREKPFDFESPSSLGLKVSPKLEKVVMKALSLKKERRFQSISEMKSAIITAVNGKKEIKKAQEKTAEEKPAEEKKVVKKLRPVRRIRKKQEPSNEKNDATFAGKITTLIYVVLFFMLVALIFEHHFRIWVLIPYFLFAGGVVFFIYWLWEKKSKKEEVVKKVKAEVVPGKKKIRRRRIRERIQK